MRGKVIGLSLLFLNACAVGPDYVRTPVAVPAHFKEASGKKRIAPTRKHWKMAEPRDDMNRGQWWKIFEDKKLNELEDKLNACNQNIVNAAQNFRQSQAIIDEARASFYPNISGTFNLIRQTQGNGTSSFTSSSIQSGTTIGTATTGNIAPKRIIRSTYADYLNANWEPDIWGQVRRTVESDVAAAQSDAALWAVTRLSMQGSLAQYYFELRAQDKDQQLLDLIVLDNKKALELTYNQYVSGVASRADVVNAQSELNLAEASAVNNGILRGQYEHAIAVLIGLPPAVFSLKFMPLKATPPAIPVAIPSLWLERRPDVAQAERMMQQANAMIGVAVSTYYPTLNLSPSVSGTSTNLGDLIKSPIVGWSLGMVLIETIFDGGLRSATVRQANK